jgi:hypothetical protein
MRAIAKSPYPCLPGASSEIHWPSMGAGEEAKLSAMQKQENLPQEGLNDK